MPRVDLEIFKKKKTEHNKGKKKKKKYSILFANFKFDIIILKP
jgi:hypothetical protein